MSDWTLSERESGPPITEGTIALMGWLFDRLDAVAINKRWSERLRLKDRRGTLLALLAAEELLVAPH